MPQTITKRSTSARKKGAESAEQPQTKATAGGLVDAVRDVVRRLIMLGQPEDRERALVLVEQQYRPISDSCPVTEDLRAWQLLATDLAAALEPIDPPRAERALELADEIRATVFMIARNPSAELAVRPASRLVLLALEALGGTGELARVRERTGHSTTHLSNLLNPLRAHGYVTIETSASDRRARALSLTAKGRAAIATQGEAPRGTPDAYPSYIHVTASIPGESVYPSDQGDRFESAHSQLT